MGSSEFELRGAALVGREPECGAIDRLLGRVSQGESGSLVLRAEAGMGKTALLGYAAARAVGMTVLSVAGVAAESDLGFAGLHSLVRPIVDHLPRVPGPQREAVAAALGLAPAGGSDRFLVSAGVLSLLAAAAEERPILCLIDDTHWLDVPSADSLVFTARRLGAEGIVMLFAAREGERRRFEAPGLDELELAGLDQEPALRLLGRSARGLSPLVRDRLLADAGGNPLALLELPACLSDEQLAGRARLPEQLPLSSRLQIAFRQQIERLSDETQAVLLLAAADDGGELASVLRAATDLDLPQDAVDAAERAGLVEIDDLTLAFRHPLVRSAVYEAATSGERRRAHAALADAYREDQHGDRHLWHRAVATLTADEQLAAALEASAKRSQLRGGHASAATGFERAAELSDGESARGRRLALAAQAAWVAGQAERARGLIDRSLPLAGRTQRVRLLYLSGVIEGRGGLLESGIAKVQQAAALSDDSSLCLEMIREASTMALSADDYEQMIALGGRAEGLPRATDVDRYFGAAVTAYAADLSGDPARGAALAAEAIELAERLDDPGCLISASHTAARQSRAADSLAYANRAVDIARERALVTTLPLALQAQAAGLAGQSRFDLAYSAAEEGWRLADDVGQPWPAILNLAQLADIDALRGAEQRVRAHLAEVQRLAANSGAKPVAKYIGRALGLLDLGLGNPGQALDRLLVPVRTVRPQSHPLFTFGVSDAVEAAVRADRLADVSVHIAHYGEWARSFPTPARLALLERSRALVDDASAEQHFPRAVELADALSPFERARIELLYGEWLRRQRRRVDARAHLRRAVDSFGPLGVAPWEARARSELRASGETARRRDPSTRDQLTPQELQIARLVASGKTNPDVAAQLFLSPRTIDYHLRKVFAKLEIASRVELAGADLGEPVAA